MLSPLRLISSRSLLQPRVQQRIGYLHEIHERRLQQRWKSSRRRSEGASSDTATVEKIAHFASCLPESRVERWAARREEGIENLRTELARIQQDPQHPFRKRQLQWDDPVTGPELEKAFWISEIQKATPDVATMEQGQPFRILELGTSSSPHDAAMHMQGRIVTLLGSYEPGANSEQTGQTPDSARHEPLVLPFFTYPMDPEFERVLDRHQAEQNVLGRRLQKHDGWKSLSPKFDLIIVKPAHVSWAASDYRYLGTCLPDRSPSERFYRSEQFLVKGPVDRRRVAFYMRVEDVLPRLLSTDFEHRYPLFMTAGNLPRILFAVDGDDQGHEVSQLFTWRSRGRRRCEISKDDAHKARIVRVDDF